MAAVTETFDIKIRVVFPFLTKSLPTDDSARINATGNFNFEPPPQVDTAQGAVVSQSSVKEISKPERVQNLKTGLNDLMADFDLIQKVMKKRAGHIALNYDPELTKNEALASAEMDLFGASTGRITYAKFEEVLAYHEKINKYIAHMSIENGGPLDAVS